MPEATDANAESSPTEIPVRIIPADIAAGTLRAPEAGTALCLSGGGYRAMLFHVGAILRLNQAGILRTLTRISSVSGGSITAGVLGMNWSRLSWDNRNVAQNLDELLVKPIRQLAGRTIDENSILSGLLLPGTIADKVASAYKRYLFDERTLANLPDDSQGPRFVINATNVQSGSLWRFSRPYMGDWQIGLIRDPAFSLARAVAASSAFPPVLSPLTISDDVDPSDFDTSTVGPLFGPPYNDTVVLSDGGVYDNLGLETAWKHYDTILVSDGGLKMSPDPEPKGDWAQHALRVLDLIDNQVRSLRKRQLIDSYVRSQRKGTYWGIRTDIADYGLPPGQSLPCPADKVAELGAVKTRLKRMNGVIQQRLINWGYAVCDAAIRRHVNPNLPMGAFPYDGGIG
jgi:NTE family protein